jgi:hypothetical protein
MRFSILKVAIYCLLFVLYGCLLSCQKPKEAKVIVSEQEVILRQDSEKSYAIDAKGKIKNVGEVDVKKVVVTRYCRSCGEEWLPGKWFVSNIEKTPDQKAVISYIAVGNEEAFSFKDITNFLLISGQKKPEMPEKLFPTSQFYVIIQISG